jgi:hypothetical protein
MTAPGITSTIANAADASLKRLAWAYGCARKGSDEEKQLEALLVQRVCDNQRKAKVPDPEPCECHGDPWCEDDK